MGTQILAPGNTAAGTADIVIADGDKATIVALGPEGYDSSGVLLQYESAEGVWHTVRRVYLNDPFVLDMVGTWRIYRNASGPNISVYRD